MSSSANVIVTGPIDLLQLTHRASGQIFLGLVFQDWEEALEFAQALANSERVIVALLWCDRATICYVRGERAGQPTATAWIRVPEPKEVPWNKLAGIVCVATASREIWGPWDINVLTGNVEAMSLPDLDALFPDLAPRLTRVL